MKLRSIALLSIILMSLMMIPQLDAAPGGIGVQGDGGCGYSR